MSFNVLFYDMIPVEKRLQEWKNGDFPGHLLYGLTHLDRYSIECVLYMIPFDPYRSRIKLMLYNLYSILFNYKKCDLIYAVTFRGLELIILLRALGLYRKPVIIWHHTAVIIPKNKIRKLFSHLFYKGIDKMFFFSDCLLQRSLMTGKVTEKSAKVIHWGGDIDFYDSLIKSRESSEGFISTGRENRDFVTLTNAFNRTPYVCDIYTGKRVGSIDYEEILARTNSAIIKPNIRLVFIESTPKEMAKKVNNAFAVVICCLDYPYTIGLTTLVEALALGLPVITTDNPTFPFDVEVEKVGIKVPYGDVDAWENAINYLATHPEKAIEMGNNGRKLSEKYYNLETMAFEISKELLIA